MTYCHQTYQESATIVENKILFTGTPTAELNSEDSTAPFVLRTAYNAFNGSLLVSFLKPEMLICINNFDPVTFDETFFMDAVKGQGFTDYFHIRAAQTKGPPVDPC